MTWHNIRVYYLRISSAILCNLTPSFSMFSCQHLFVLMALYRIIITYKVCTFKKDDRSLSVMMSNRTAYSTLIQCRYNLCGFN